MLSGKTFHARNGVQTTGTMLDYNTFPFFVQDIQRYVKTLTSSGASLPLDAFDLHGRPIKFILVGSYYVMGNVQRPSSGDSTPYIYYLAYFADRKGFLAPGSATANYWFGSAVRVSRSSSNVASIKNLLISTDTGWTVRNSDQLATGGASLYTSSGSTNGYFLKDCPYSIIIGG